MSTLDAHELHYEDMAPRKLKLVQPDRKDSKMSKKTPEETNTKGYNKTRGEHVKDMVIVALIVGIVSFTGGLYFANKHQAEIKAAVSTATAQITPAQPAAKK